jgi:flagellar protein FliL
MSTAPAANAAPAEGEAPAKKSKGKLLLVVGAVVLLLGGGGGFWFWKSKQATAEPEVAKVEPPAPLQFHPLDPAFVVNFQAGATARFLQLEVRIGSRELETIEMLKANDPVIRNDLLLMYGSQDYTQLTSREGKEKLRADTLTAIRKIVKAEGGKPESVEAAFFTSFVMQ